MYFFSCTKQQKILTCTLAMLSRFQRGKKKRFAKRRTSYKVQATKRIKKRYQPWWIMTVKYFCLSYHVLHQFFSQVVIDTIKLRFFKQLSNLGTEIFRRFQIFAKRFLNDNSSPSTKVSWKGFKEQQSIRLTRSSGLLQHWKIDTATWTIAL